MSLKFIKSLSAYTFVGFFGAAINFLVMPVLSHHLSPSDYGVMSIFNAYVTIAVPLIGLVSTGLILVEYYKNEDKEEFASLFSSIQVIPLLPFFLFLIVFYFFQERLSLLLEIPVEDSAYLLLIPVIAILTIYNESYFSYLVATKQASRYVLSNVGKVIIEVGLTLLFVIYFKWGWQGRILSWLIISTCLTLLAAIYFNFYKLLTFQIKWVYVKAGIFFGLPLILHTLGKFVINQSDRLFIAKMVNLSEAGIYNIGYQIGGLVLLLVSAFQNIYVPFVYERLKENTHTKKVEIVRLSYGFVIVLFAGVLALTAITPILFKTIINQQYIEGVKYVFWVSFGYLIWGTYMIFAAYIFYYKKNKILGYLAIFNIALNLTLNYFFIKELGAIGATYATCVSFFIILLFVMFYSRKLITLPWFDFRSILNRPAKTIN